MPSKLEQIVSNEISPVLETLKHLGIDPSLWEAAVQEQVTVAIDKQVNLAVDSDLSKLASKIVVVSNIGNKLAQGASMTVGDLSLELQVVIKDLSVAITVQLPELPEEKIRRLWRAHQILINNYLANKNIDALFGKKFKVDSPNAIAVHMIYQVENLRLPEDKQVFDMREKDIDDIEGARYAISVNELFLSDIAFREKHNIPLPGDMKHEKPIKAAASKKKTNVVLIGRAGVGKSVLAVRIAREYAESVSTHNKKTPKKSLLQDYAWVFLLTIRKLNVVFDKIDNTLEFGLRDWIFYSYFSGKLSKDEYETLWRDELHPKLLKGKVALIIDGLDEMTSKVREHGIINALLAGEYLNVPKIVTSRHSGIMHFPDNCRISEVMGFKPEGVSSYVARYFEGYEHNEVAATLDKQIKNLDMLTNTMQTPLLLNMYCGTYAAWDKSNRTAKENITSNQSIKPFSSNMDTLTGLYQVFKAEVCARHNATVGEHIKLPSLAYQPAKRRKVLFDHYAAEITFLSLLAFNAVQNESIVISKGIIGMTISDHDGELIDDEAFINKLFKLGFIKPAQAEDSEDKSIEFIHLSFQSFFAADHISSILRSSSKKIQNAMWDFIAKNRFNPKFENMWVYLAGLLKDTPDLFAQYVKVFTDNTLQLPWAPYQGGLVARIYHEAHNANMPAVLNEAAEQLKACVNSIYEIYTKDRRDRRSYAEHLFRRIQSAESVLQFLAPIYAQNDTYEPKEQESRVYFAYRNLIFDHKGREQLLKSTHNDKELCSKLNALLRMHLSKKVVDVLVDAETALGNEFYKRRKRLDKLPRSYVLPHCVEWLQHKNTENYKRAILYLNALHAYAPHQALWDQIVPTFIERHFSEEYYDPSESKLLLRCSNIVMTDEQKLLLVKSYIAALEQSELADLVCFDGLRDFAEVVHEHETIYNQVQQAYMAAGNLNNKCILAVLLSNNDGAEFLLECIEGKHELDVAFGKKPARDVAPNDSRSASTSDGSYSNASKITLRSHAIKALRLLDHTNISALLITRMKLAEVDGPIKLTPLDKLKTFMEEAEPSLSKKSQFEQALNAICDASLDESSLSAQAEFLSYIGEIPDLLVDQHLIDKLIHILMNTEHESLRGASITALADLASETEFEQKVRDLLEKYMAENEKKLPYLFIETLYNTRLFFTSEYMLDYFLDQLGNRGISRTYSAEKFVENFNPNESQFYKILNTLFIPHFSPRSRYFVSPTLIKHIEKGIKNEYHFNFMTKEKCCLVLAIATYTRWGGYPVDFRNLSDPNERYVATPIAGKLVKFTFTPEEAKHFRELFELSIELLDLYEASFSKSKYEALFDCVINKSLKYDAALVCLSKFNEGSFYHSPPEAHLELLARAFKFAKSARSDFLHTVLDQIHKSASFSRNGALFYSKLMSDNANNTPIESTSSSKNKLRNV